ncbi:MAG: cytochrome P460 family protein [Gemmatimonadota bacterium]
MTRSIPALAAAVLISLGCQPRPAPPVDDPVEGPVEAVTHPETGIALPRDYRETFTNYLSLDRVQNHNQIIRLFANDVAMRGPDAANDLPNGSVIVAEVYRAKLDAEGEVELSALGRRIRDGMAVIAVMERGDHLGAGYPEGLSNGQWDFAAFTPEGAPAGADLNTCRACHAPLTETDHLFSIEHIRE